MPALPIFKGLAIFMFISQQLSIDYSSESEWKLYPFPGIQRDPSTMKIYCGCKLVETQLVSLIVLKYNSGLKLGV